MKNGPYILIKAPNKYPGKRYRGRYAYEHHVVYWKKYKLIPKLGEVIHHKNHDKTDNKINNLELISLAEHSKHHARLVSYSELECFHCKVIFKRNSRQVKWKLKTGQKRFFCCRSHQIIVQQKERKFRGA